MKIKRGYVAAFLWAFAFGCGKSDQSNQSPTNSLAAATVNVITNQQTAGKEIEQYGHTLAQAKKKAIVQTDFISVDRAIQAFQADKGRNPENLDELIKEKFLPRLPDLPAGKAYSYNPETGQVKVVDAQ
jgi:hypothetical protein